jgi:polyhydroxybutyrate depolymerase
MSTMRIAMALIVAFVVACGSSGDDTTPPAGPAPGATPMTGDPAAMPGSPTMPPGTSTPAPTTCAGKGPLSGDLDWKISSDKVDRTVHVHVPKSYVATTGTPVVMSFHGYTSNGSQQDILARMSEKADKAGFIAVHPEGTGTTPSWNAGACCGDAASTAIDDIAFVGKIIDELELKLCVDPHRIYATGMSNGGFLSHRIACELSTRVAAVAPVAGVLAIPTCLPARPVPIFQFHGTADGLVAYNGNPGLGFPSVPQTMAAWAARNGCGKTARETVKKGDVTCLTYDGCKAGAEVSLCTVMNGGHTWPGGTPVPTLGYTTMDIVATDAMWDFFVKHPLP